MSCCGNPAVDAILNELPNELTPTMFNNILMEAPRVFDEEIQVQADKSPNLFTGLLESKQFPTDQTEYNQIRLTRSSGLQYYNNREVFRKAYSPDNCAPGCTWQPRSFDAGRQIVSSTLEVADFEQEVPCLDNMLKKYAFVEFFLQVPEFLKGYMEDIAAQYVRNELLGRAKKIILTNERSRASKADPRKFANMIGSDANVMLLGDLNPSSLTTLYDEITSYHPDCQGFLSKGGYQMLGLMIEPMQWRLKQLTDKLYSNFIIQNPTLSSAFFDRFTVHETFAEMFAILATKDLPRADVDENGEVLYHHRYIDVPTGSGGVKREGNPGYAEAEYGVALIVNNDLGFLWDEAPLPITQIGNAKFGPQYGQVSMENRKWAYLPNYDYKLNPLGKGGKWISQYKTGFHPGPGAECLYAILYPLTKYANIKQGLPEGECIVTPSACADNFADTGCPCPIVKDVYNITSTKAVIKTDTDIGVAAEETFKVEYDDGSEQTLTADVVTSENGIFIYTVSSATAIKGNCIKNFVCAPVDVACSSKVLSTSDAKQPTKWGMQLESCFNAPVATSLVFVHADGTEVTTTVTEIEAQDVSGVSINYHFAAISYETIVQNGDIVLVKSTDGDACPEVDPVIDCA